VFDQLPAAGFSGQTQVDQQAPLAAVDQSAIQTPHLSRRTTGREQYPSPSGQYVIQHRHQLLLHFRAGLQLLKILKDQQIDFLTMHPLELANLRHPGRPLELTGKFRCGGSQDLRRGLFFEDFAVQLSGKVGLTGAASADQRDDGCGDARVAGLKSHDGLKGQLVLAKDEKRVRFAGDLGACAGAGLNHLRVSPVREHPEGNSDRGPLQPA
jgi:hypothetical protein